MITNADTGVAVTWAWQVCPPAVDPIRHNGTGPGNLGGPKGKTLRVVPGCLSISYGMAITNGTGASIMEGPVVANQLSEVAPVLQNQDGSFSGIVLTGDSNNPETDMVVFDQGGGVRMLVPNEQPMIATADGGIIGQSGITYGGSGGATGQGSLATQSWTYNSYQVGSTDRIFLTPILLATSWAFQQQTTGQKPYPDSVKAISDVVTGPIPLLREIIYLPFQGNHPWKGASATITEYLIKIDGIWPPLGCASGYPTAGNETFCGSGVEKFDDLIGRGFVRRQQIFVNFTQRAQVSGPDLSLHGPKPVRQRGMGKSTGYRGHVHSNQQ